MSASGDNTITGTSANDTLNGGAGADTLLGGAGDDRLSGGSGSDLLDGGSGSDRLSGDSGNDTLVYVVADNTSSTDIYDGGAGFDRLRLILTSAEWLSAAVQLDVQNYLAFIADHTLPSAEASNTEFRFTTFDLRVSKIETVEVVVDGVVIDPTHSNHAPVVQALAADSAGTATPIAETNAPLRASGTLTVTDADVSDVVAVSVQGVQVISGFTNGMTTEQLLSFFSAGPGSVAADPGTTSNVNLLFNSTPHTFDYLDQDEVLELRYTVRATDDSGAGNNIGDGTVTIRIKGTNDAPDITGGVTSGSVKEDVGTLSQAVGQLTAVDPDHGATRTWTVVGGTATGTADYHFRADSFKVQKGATVVLFDDFTDGAPPPNSPDFNVGQPNQMTTTYGGIGTFSESGGKLLFDSNNAVSFVGVGTNDPIIGQDAIVRTSVDSNPTGLGLKVGTPFTITGVFDLIMPDSPREAYGIRVTDRLLNPVTNADSTVTPAQLGDNTYELVVRENVAGQNVVSLRHLDFNTNMTTNLQNLNLTPPPGADQITLKLDHVANSLNVTASFQYMSGGTLLGPAQTFTSTAPIFAPGSADTEVWTRAEIVAYAPQFTDSILGGSYGTLNIGQSGTWTYLINNALASTQSLSEGQHVTDTFNVKVADQFGAFDTQTINIDVVGSNDRPTFQPPPPSNLVFGEDSAAMFSTSGFINFADVDLQDTHTVGAFLQNTVFSGGPVPPPLQVPLQNALTATLVDPATGDGHGQLQWNFSLANSAVQFLGGGQTLTLTYRPTVTDASPYGGSQTTPGPNVVFTIFGQNDVPVIAGPSTINLGPLSAPIGIPGQPFELANNLSFSDADITDVHGVGAFYNAALSDAGVQLGNLTATLLNDTANGTGGLVHWSFTIDPALVSALPAGVVRHETFDVVINDSTSALAVEHITVTINGGGVPPSGVSFATLDYPGAAYTIANDINDYGEIVGQTGNVSGPYSGWDYKEGMFAPVTVAGNTSANTVNLYGIVGGYYEPFSSSTPRYGFTENNGVFTNPIDLSPNISTTVDGINDLGTFVGSSYLGGANFRGYIDVGGTVTYLTAPGASSTSANGINNANDVVGSYYDGQTHGFLYRNGTYTTVDAPGATKTVAVGINNAGQIVGWYVDATGHTHGFVDTGGVFTTIDDPFGANGTFVHGINDMGEIVGRYIDAANVQHGFIADIAGGNVVMGTPLDNTLNGTTASDMLLGLAGHDLILPGLGNDVVDGGTGTDIVVYSGPRANYTVTNPTVHVSVAGPDGSDQLSYVELLNFSDSYVMVSPNVDISVLAPGTLVPLLPIIGINGGNALTVGTNANGHPIDLGTGPSDNLFLADSGFPHYSLELHNVEGVWGLGDGETVDLVNTQNGIYVDLGQLLDTLNLANGGNTVTVANTETVNGGAGNDSVTLDTHGGSGDLINVWGRGGADTFDFGSYAHNHPVSFHYGSLSESPAGAGRDTIDGFDASQDIINLTGLGIAAWDVSGGIFHAYLAGDSVADLEIALPNLHGTLVLGPHVLI